MNINSKFIYALTREAFERELPNIPEKLDPIVFIEDTKELWTHGTYFSLGYPTVSVSELSGRVVVNIGENAFTIQTSGSSLSVKKGVGNNIVISSIALTAVSTQAPLEWKEDTKQLVHQVSGVDAGQFGQTSSLSNASIFYIPTITVDAYGHVKNVKNSTIAIRDYVEQLAPSEFPVDRNILVSYNEASNTSETSQIRKASGLLYNDATKLLTVPGGIRANDDVTINNGNLQVVGGIIIGDLQGNVTGEATPKIHLSDLPEYGGASTELYGHVRLQDTLGVEPPPSSTNSDKESANVVSGIAASPKMVWDVQAKVTKAINDLKTATEGTPTLGGFSVGDQQLILDTPGQIIPITPEGGISVTLTDGGILIKSPSIEMYDENENEKTITNSLKFTKDFTNNTSGEVEIRWTEI